MSFPEIPNITPTISITTPQTVPLLLASIALEELALAHLLNAEAEKLQFVLGTLTPTRTTFSPPVVSISDLLLVNASIQRTLRDVIKKEMLLEFKFENVLELISTLPTPPTVRPTHILAPGGEIQGGLATSAVDLFFCEQNLWQTPPPDPLLPPREAHAGGLLPNGLIIVSHGFLNNAGNPANATSTAEFFNQGTQSWSAAPPATFARGSLGGDVLNGIYYAVGGLGTTGIFLGTTEKFDGISWSQSGTLATPRAQLAVVALDGFLHAIGGFNGAELTTHEALDPATGTWSPRAPLPAARAFLSAAAFDGKIYVFGGRATGNIATAEVFIYDPTTDSWTSGAPMPTSRWGTAASVCDSEIFVMGGFVPPSSYLNIVEAYNPVTNTWRTNVAPMPNARALFPGISF